MRIVCADRTARNSEMDRTANRRSDYRVEGVSRGRGERPRERRERRVRGGEQRECRVREGIGEG